MNQLKLLVIKLLSLIFLISMGVVPLQAAIIQNPKLSNTDDGFLELKPNGSLILRSTLNNSSSVWQEAMIFKTILNAIRLMPLQTKSTLNDLNQKIYGDGVEHKFPPFMERVIQRIQTYFSIYKYTDTSKPVREDYKPTSTTATSTTTSQTLTLGQNEIDVNLTSDSNSFNRNNKTSLSVDKYTRPIKTTTTPSTITTRATTPPPPPLVEYDADEENEFIEIKKANKSIEKKKS